MNEHDVLICGAGPAGVAASLFLSRKGIRHTIVDKAAFPRDKICGDAISGKSVHVLNRINPSLVKEMADNAMQFTGSYGICFFAPDGRKLEVPFSSNPALLKNAPGFVSRRMDFDNFLFKQLDRNFASVETSTEISGLHYESEGVVSTFRNAHGETKRTFKLVVGADGERSVVSKFLCPAKKDLSTYCAALRVYYSGVTGMHERKFIELHFIKELLPGYFWIFPMNDGCANVGIGMLSKVVSEKKVNLKEKLKQIIEQHPEISMRFKNAKAEGEVSGWGLPLGSARRRLTGNRFLLTGDAGSLIDPFTGEGIGNALYSGMLAADMIESALKENRFDSAYLSQYEHKLYKNLNEELRLSHGIQKLARHAWLFNFVVRKASKNAMLRDTITCMFDDLDIRSRLRKPSFYFKLLFD